MSTSSGRCTRRSCGTRTASCRRSTSRSSTTRRPAITATEGGPGDLGIVAAADGGVVGVAYSRLFTHDGHGHGYLDDETPEVAVAVREDYRGRGLGGWLLNELAQAAEAEGFTRLSLSVAADNPARRLYERLGYEEVSADESGLRMALELGRRV